MSSTLQVFILIPPLDVSSLLPLMEYWVMSKPLKWDISQQEICARSSHTPPLGA
jgi:hypothetical protein